MGYQVKWVEDHLGVSRKALRLFEKFGLMPANEGNQYRNYSEEDIERIWAIRVLQGIGYSLKEIATITSDETFDFQTSITEKVKELEVKRQEADRHLGYAEMIKMTGRLPTRPRQLGEICWKDFQKQSLDNWNMRSDPKAVEYQKVAEKYLYGNQEEWGESDIGRMFAFLEGVDTDFMAYACTDYGIIRGIIRRINLGADHPEVQTLVKLLYEEQQQVVGAFSELTPTDFGRLYSSSYIEGDIGLMNQKKYGREECVFVADAIAVFGGYKNYDEIIQGG